MKLFSRVVVYLFVLYKISIVTKKLVIYYLSFQKKEVYLQSRTGPLTAGLVFIGHLIYLTGN